ncbi:hypothetical protein Trydic_g1253 [Trypoxylus dichotomus]
MVKLTLAERIDEKIHRRTTVRMGIRVIQRAFAPPSPYLYSPGGPMPSSRDKYKQKITLFGCQTTPLETTDTRLLKQTTTNSEEVRLTMNRVYESSGNADVNSRRASIAPKVEKKILDLADRVDGYIEDAILNDRTPTHMVRKDTSRESLRNGNNGEENKQDKPTEADNEENTAKKEVRIERKESILSVNEITAVTRIRSSCGGKRPSLAAFLAGVPPPHAMVEKPFLLSDGRIELEAQLNKGIYYHGEEILVSISVRNNSNKSIRRIKVFVVQHVDVCMFSNGKFKNVVAVINTKDNCPITSGSSYEHTYGLVPTKSSTKNWIALEDSYTKSGTSLASSVMCSSNSPDDRNVFAIYVSYYVKVKLIVSVMGGEVSIKLPFTLMHTCNEADSPIEMPRTIYQRKSVVEEVKPEKDAINSQHHRLELMRLKQAAQEKRPEWHNRHEMILQHDNARPHVGQPV